MRYYMLTRNSDFTRAYMRGKVCVHPYFVVYINKNRQKRTRIGITATKKVGNAVVRNRARRVLRAALQETVPHYVGNYDIVLVARALTAKLKSPQVASSLRKQLILAGLMHD